MNIDIKLHKKDLPDEIVFSDKIAIDCEFTGLNIERDRLCLLQISSKVFPLFVAWSFWVSITNCLLRWAHFFFLAW